ncbi:MAG: ATP-binding protein [bacterium]|nr:ATP-binding protein [bacterium]
MLDFHRYDACADFLMRWQRVMKKMISLRKKIAFFTSLASLFALLAGVGVTIVLYQNKVRQQSAAELTRITQNTPSLIETSGHGLAAVARTLVISPALTNAVVAQDYFELLKYCANFASTNHLDLVEITDAKGCILLNLEDTLRQGQASSNPLVQSALRGGPYGFGLLKQNDQLYIAATIPFHRSSNTLGAITIGNTFNRELVQQFMHVPGVEFAFWTDPEKTGLVPMGKTALPPIVKMLNREELFNLESGQTLLKDVTVGDNSLQCVFSSLTELGGQIRFYFVNYRSLNYLVQAGELTIIPVIALSLLILLLMVRFAWWVSHRVSEPLEELTKAAKEMARLNFNQPVSFKGFKEIEELNASFNFLSRALRETMEEKDSYAEKLESLNKNLEHIISQRTEELEHINLRLQKEVTEKDDFLRTVSHDLGAPLRNIAGLTKLLERKIADSLDEDGRDKLDRIRNNAIRQLEMLDQLLELSRLKTRRSRWETVDLMEVLGQIRQDFSYLIEERGIRLVLGDILPVVFAERDRMQRIFQNLIDNAIKYMGRQPHPEIEIGWSVDADFYLFFVRDNGMGVPPDQHNKIFGVFQRVKNQEISAIAGKGIGLASVKTIVELYNGEIWVDSKQGEGSTFYFTLDRNLVDPLQRSEILEEKNADKLQVEVYEENSVN